MSKRWAVTLCLNPNDRKEEILDRIISFLQNNEECNEWSLADFDATGEKGDYYTKKLNLHRKIAVPTKVLIEICREEGEILELDAQSIDRASYQIIVRDGKTIDIVSSGSEIPSHIIGGMKEIDPDQF